jgi:ABC-type uncharacterized transport system permease subunit
MPQESKASIKETQLANNRRLGVILLSIAAAFFIGILLKRSLLG